MHSESEHDDRDQGGAGPGGGEAHTPHIKNNSHIIQVQSPIKTMKALNSASSGGCNRTVGSFVWLTNSLIFYAAHRTVVVYDVERRQSLATLLGHNAVVTCVDGVHEESLDGNGSSRFLIVSGAADGAVMAWDVQLTESMPEEHSWSNANENAGTQGSSRPHALCVALAGVETTGPVTGVCCHTHSYRIPGSASRTQHFVAVSSGDGGGAVRLLELSAEGLRTCETIRVGTLVQCVRLVGFKDTDDYFMGANTIRDGNEARAAVGDGSSSDSVSVMVLAGGFVDGSVRLWGIGYCWRGVFGDTGDREYGGEDRRGAHPGTYAKFHVGDPCVLRQQHQNWVRAIDIAWDATRRRMVMATASQDRYVRVWSFQKNSGLGTDLNRLDAYAPKPKLLLALGSETGQDIPVINANVVCEALLAGHEDWVHGVRFHASSSKSELTLLSSSMDRTMMLWRRDDADLVSGDPAADVDAALWQSVTVVGDAGINHLGYYTCAWRPDGRSIATHGHSGAFHVWDARGDDEDDLSYVPRTPACCCGHMGRVVDSSWSPDGRVLCTVSTDQTCRLWTASTVSTVSMTSIVLKDGEDGEQERSRERGNIWREVGRPQVHGHDFSCVAFVSNDVYVSGSDEKVLRVFSNAITDERGARVRVKLPALGLSNVVDDENNDENDVDAKTINNINSQHASITEEDLSQNTLWPEVRKLYGHGNDLYSVAADPKGRYVASASRAQEQVSAAVIVWDASTWNEVARIVGHDLTVTCIACSPSGNLLATVGRDRKINVWEMAGDDENDLSTWRIVASASKAHTRVIWGCSWLDEGRLVTCSRDGTVRVWGIGSGSEMDVVAGDHNDAEGCATVSIAKRGETKLGSSVMSVSACSRRDSDCQPVAAGLESGQVMILEVNRNDDRIKVIATCSDGKQHAGAVRRVEFCPDPTVGGAVLSSVGDDGAVKFWQVM